MTKKWFTESVEETLTQFNVSTEQGLTSEEVEQRQAEHGKNELQEQEGKSALELFLHQFKNPLIFILGIGAIVSFFTYHLVDAIAITVIIFINAIIAFWQEFKAQKGMEALREMAAPTAQVRRNGEWVDVLARDIVPGDILKINAGDILAADVRIIEVRTVSQ
ncbi:cation-transporting P-type ATPase [Vibrio harveyi]|nr:cation-transporting P-type ATPase [Vibrio harveyi]